MGPVVIKLIKANIIAATAAMIKCKFDKLDLLPMFTPEMFI